MRKLRWAVPCAAVAMSPAFCQTLAYVTNQRSETVSVIDVATNRVTATISFSGSQPSGIAASADGKRVWVVGSNDNTVSGIDTTRNVITTRFGTGTTPLGVAINPAGTRVFVANMVSNTISIINTTNNSFLPSVTVRFQPAGIAVSPDGNRVYVTNVSTGDVAVIDPNRTVNGAASPVVLATVKVGKAPIAAAPMPDGKTMWVVNTNSNSIQQIGIADNRVQTTLATQNSPVGIAIRRDAPRAYVTNFWSGSISVVDTESLTTQAPIDLPLCGTERCTPMGIDVTPDGKSLYVANANSNTVSVIDTETGKVTATIRVGDGPRGVAISSTPVSALVTGDDSLSEGNNQ